MNVEKVETCNTVRTAMKVWNTTVQYWMANCVYKPFPLKGLRTAAVFLLSSAWHGYAPGYFLCISQITFFLPMEDIYVKIYKQCPDNSPVSEYNNYLRKYSYSFLKFNHTIIIIFNRQKCSWVLFSGF